MLETTTYIFLGLVGFFAMLWALLSMGIVSTRDHELYVEKEQYIEQITDRISKTYEYLEDTPFHNRDKVRAHLDRGEVNAAHDLAKAAHDVHFFFRNY